MNKQAEEEHLEVCSEISDVFPWHNAFHLRASKFQLDIVQSSFGEKIKGNL
jgi:hypothetical protein